MDEGAVRLLDAADCLDNEIQFCTRTTSWATIATGLLLGRHGGVFNVAGDGTMTMRECAALIGSPVRKLLLRVYRALAKAMWAAREVRRRRAIEFALHPWIVWLQVAAHDRLAAPPHEPRDLRDHDARARQAGTRRWVNRTIADCYAGRLTAGLAPPCSRAVSSAGESACSTSRRSLVRAQYGP